MQERRLSDESRKHGTGSVRPRLALGWVDAVIAVAVVLLLIFPVASRLVADSLPVAPRASPALPPIPRSGPAPGVRSLPEFMLLSRARVTAIMATGTSAEREIRLLAGALFGSRRAVAFMGTLAEPFGQLSFRAGSFAGPHAEMANDLAALLMLIAGVGTSSGPPASSDALSNAGAVSLFLLERDRAAGMCAPALNYAFLLAAANPPFDPAQVTAAYRTAIADCPHDPTAGWALGQYQSLLAPTSGVSEAATLATFAAVQRSFPRSPAGWAGEGDAELRFGYRLAPQPGVPGEPFTARLMFERALALYRRAMALSPGAGTLAGLARAQAALGEPLAAEDSQRRAVALDPSSAPLQARELDYLQRAHEFSQAAVVAARFARVHTFPHGTALYAQPVDEDQDTDEDGDEPLSIGVDTFVPVTIAIGPTSGAQAGSEVNDFAYLPVYVPMSGVGGDARWCPGWSRLVDLLLAGRPRAVLAGYGAGSTFADLGPSDSDCQAAFLLNHGAQELPGVAELELGDLAAARVWARRARTSLGELEDLRQNLWRYAGDFGHAAIAAAQWAQLRPSSGVAILREGEIAFLRHRYDTAVLDFSVAANQELWRHGATLDGALGLLDEGTALVSAGRRTEALQTLAEAVTRAAEWSEASRHGTEGQAPQIAAFAQELAGQTELADGRYQDAADDFAEAANSATQVGGAAPLQAGGESLRPEVLDNNRSIAEIAVADPAFAATLSTQAIGQDPGDAIAWWTLAEAQRSAGHTVAAVADYRAALARDPTEFPAANNLGVLLLHQGRVGAAVAALRRSVGANRSYAIGWFNLGVALGREGPLHLLAAEGSFAQARRLDPALGSRAPKPFFDSHVYQSRLDLSKPLPPKWTFASSQSRAPVAAAGISALLLLVVGIARALVARASTPEAQGWLGVLDRIARHAPRSPLLRGPALAIAATAAVLLWPLLSGPVDQWSAQAAFLVGIAILIAVVLRVRRHAARLADTVVREETWLPSVGFGLAMAIAGLSWTPLPVARARGKAVSIHWVGPTAIAVLALALLLLSVWTGVPVTRSLGAAALVMAASMLTPVSPLDGATVSATPAGALPTLAVLGTAVLLVVGLL